MKVCSVCQRCFEDAVLSCSDAQHAPLIEGRAGSCEIIANYRLDQRREASRRSETYRASNKILNKTYLIRILAPDAFADQKAKDAFLRETRELSAIVHPNVARVFESGGLADGSAYVVTEFSTAQTLRDCLKNVGAPSEVTALTITRQAAEGLEAIHAAGVLHKNLSPENLILTSDAENRFLVKLQNIDFGGVHQTTVRSEAELHLPDLRYFSPEQCAGQELDARSDVYSLSVVLYEILAGKPPFDGPDAGILINKQINEPPPPVEIHNFDIRMLVTHTLTDALQKTTRLRLKSASALTRRLRHIEQLATHSSTPPPAMSYPAAMDKAAVRFSPAPKLENPPPVETKPIIENVIPPPVETKPVVEDVIPVEKEPVAEIIALPVRAFDDYSTTKLPPLETIIENPPPAAEPPVPASPLIYETAANPDIHITNEAVLLEWEQPDDVPTITQALGKKRKVVADAAFAAPSALNAAQDLSGIAKVPVIELGMIDTVPEVIEARPAIVEERPEIVEARQEIAEERQEKAAAARPVFSYNDAGRAWSLPAKRKLLTGAGIVALFVFAVGGTLLSRQSQLSRDTEQTTAQSAPKDKSVPKSADADKVAGSDQSSPAKPETLNVSNPVSASEDSNLPDLPDYQPRATEEKTTAPAAQNRSRKRASRQNSENAAKNAETKTVSSPVVFDKKGEMKPVPNDKKSSDKKSAKSEALTRPRIVKNPKF